MNKKFVINFEIEIPDTYLVNSVTNLQAKELIAEKLQEIVADECNAKIDIQIIK